MTITVWGRRNSMNVQKVMWALGELDLAYERHDMAGSFGVDDEYLKLNPNGVVPTIQDGDLTMYESNACVRYLARTYGQGSLCPVDAGQAAVADQWMDWQATTLSQAFFMIFFNKIRVPAEKSDPNQIERGKAHCADLFSKVDKVLSSSRLVVGDELTMGDIPIAVLLYRYYEMDVERPDLPNLARYYEDISSRPAYQKHVMIPFGTNSDEWLAEEQKNAGIQ